MPSTSKITTPIIGKSPVSQAEMPEIDFALIDVMPGFLCHHIGHHEIPYFPGCTPGRFSSLTYLSPVAFTQQGKSCFGCRWWPHGQRICHPFYGQGISNSQSITDNRLRPGLSFPIIRIFSLLIEMDTFQFSSEDSSVPYSSAASSLRSSQPGLAERLT